MGRVGACLHGPGTGDLPFQAWCQHCAWPPPCSVPFRGRFPHLSRHITRPWRYMDEIRQPSWAGGSRNQQLPRAPNLTPKGKRWWRATKAGCRLSRIRDADVLSTDARNAALDDNESSGPRSSRGRREATLILRVFHSTVVACLSTTPVLSRLDAVP